MQKSILLISVCVGLLSIGYSIETDAPPSMVETLPDASSAIVLEGHTNTVISVAFSPDGKKIVTGGGDGTARIWDAAPGKESEKIDGHILFKFEDLYAEVRVAVFSPDGKKIATANGGTIRIWDTETGKELTKLEGDILPCCSAVFSPDGKKIVTCGNSVQIWDVDSGKELHKLEVVPNRVTGYASTTFSPDGKRIVAICGRKIFIWDTDSGKELRRIERKKELWRIERDDLTQGLFPSFSDIVVSPDGGKIITVSKDISIENESEEPRNVTSINEKLQVWDADSGKELQKWEGYGGGRVAISPDGKKIAVGCIDGKIRILDSETGKELKRFEKLERDEYSKNVLSVAFSPDGKRIAGCVNCDVTVRIWTLE